MAKIVAFREYNGYNEPQSLQPCDHCALFFIIPVKGENYWFPSTYSYQFSGIGRRKYDPE